MKKIMLTLASALMLFSLASCKGKKTDGKVWIVATDTVFRPFEYTNEKNEFVGILPQSQKIRASNMTFSHSAGMQVLPLFR